MRERLKASYSPTGGPSIDPELLLRMLLIGYLYGITSERKLVEELRMHLAWRWFTGLGFDQEIPHHSTFSKNRHGRFQESKLFEQLFEEIVARCLAAGLVEGDNLSVDGSFIEANANTQSRIPREQLAEAAQVKRSVRQYLVELEEQNPIEEPVHQQEQLSTTDPDATYATKGGTPARLGLLRQLPDRQSQLCDCGRASDSRPHEPGDGGSARHDRSLRRMARTRARVGGRRCHLRERRVFAMVTGAGHHTVYAHPGQCSPEEQPALWPRPFHLSSRKQQLSLSRRPATQLRRFERQESNPCLHRKPQALRCVPTKKRNAPLGNTSISPSISMSPPGNAPES